MTGNVISRGVRFFTNYLHCSSLLTSRRITKFQFLVTHSKVKAFSTGRSTNSTMASSSKVHVNQLAHERSPYLLQHAHNPVNWFPWNDEAINKARNENKLIFLSVGYSTCHWCHVMERESFENETIAFIMNENFVNIKVDREERPDVDKIYMTFVQLTSGSGGWPMSVFLTPDLNAVAGGTYFPPEDNYGRPGFKSILLKISKQWKENPLALRETGDTVISLLRKASTFEMTMVDALTKGAVPEEGCAKLCLHQLSRHFDDDFGGFEFAPKFPQPSNLMFLFHIYSRNVLDAQCKSALTMALKTLEKMAKGGIHDHVGQGFARYSTDEKWHVPHFEKMLYDQGQLAVAYATAYLITKKQLFADVVRDILTYVGRDLSHKEGGFYSAEDADSLATEDASEKREGAFYVWTYDEIESVLSQPLESNENIRLSEVFSHHYNIRKNGNVDPQNDPHGELIDQNVLIVFGSEEETAEKFGITVDVLNRELRTARAILFEERNKRPRPHLDSKIITSWNGLMLSGYAKAAQVFQDDKYKMRAVQAATFIKKYLWLENAKELLHCCYVDEKSENIVQINMPIHGFLNDYVFLIRGLLDLYECTYDPQWIEWSEQLQDIQNNLFWDDAGKAYNMCSANDHATLLTLKDDQDGAEPAGNSVTVQNLLRLSGLLDRDEYHDKATQILSVFTSRLTRLPASLPEMVCGLMFYHDSATQIFIVEKNESDKAKEMLTAVQQYYIPNRVLAVVDENENSTLCLKSEMAKRMKDSCKGATAHVCRNRVCSIPVTTVDELEALLNQK